MNNETMNIAHSIVIVHSFMFISRAPFPFLAFPHSRISPPVGDLFSRLQNLTAMPLFWDEAYHVNNARQILFGESYFGAMSVARWFNTVLLALFNRSESKPRLIRASTVLFT